MRFALIMAATPAIVSPPAAWCVLGAVEGMELKCSTPLLKVTHSCSGQVGGGWLRGRVGPLEQTVGELVRGAFGLSRHCGLQCRIGLGKSRITYGGETQPYVLPRGNWLVPRPEDTVCGGMLSFGVMDAWSAEGSGLHAPHSAYLRVTDGSPPNYFEIK